MKILAEGDGYIVESDQPIADMIETSFTDIQVREISTNDILYYGVHFIPWAVNLEKHELLESFATWYRSTESDYIDSTMYVGPTKNWVTFNL